MSLVATFKQNLMKIVILCFLYLMVAKKNGKKKVSGYSKICQTQNLIKTGPQTYAVVEN